jgi:hypothetical protein
VTVNRINAGAAVPSAQRRTSRPAQAPVAREDSVHIAGTAAGRKGSATYTRADAISERAGIAAARSDELEAGMATDPRTLKIADIRKRIDEGAYNSRGIIEQVVDRLLEKWGFKSTSSADQHRP